MTESNIDSRIKPYKHTDKSIICNVRRGYYCGFCDQEGLQDESDNIRQKRTRANKQEDKGGRVYFEMHKK